MLFVLAANLSSKVAILKSKYSLILVSDSRFEFCTSCLASREYLLMYDQIMKRLTIIAMIVPNNEMAVTGSSMTKSPIVKFNGIVNDHN